MREEDRELLRRLQNGAPEGVDLEARAQSLKELEEAANIDDRVISALENVIAVHETTMFERVGHVFGWTANIIAVSIIGLTIWLVTTGKDQDAIKVVIVGSAGTAVAYGIGRALRYVLAGNR